MNYATANTIHRTATTMAAVSAVASPIPLADELVLIPTYGVLSFRIGRRHGLAWRAIPWRPIGITATRGLIARGFVNLGVAFLPGVDAAVNAGTSFALTELFGRYVDGACDDPKHAAPLEFRNILDAIIPSKSETDGGRERHRFRMEVPGLLGDQSLAQRLTVRSREVQGVVLAEANPRTGRLLIEIEGSVATPREQIQRILDSEVDNSGELPPSFGRIAHDARDTLKRATRTIRQFIALRKPNTRLRLPTSETPSRPYHAVAATDVLAEFGADVIAGLQPDRAKENLRTFGPNLLPGMTRRSRTEIVAVQVFTAANGLLTSAMALSSITGDWLEAGAIAIVMLSNIAIGYVTESRAEELLLAWGKLRVDRATVIREGRETTIRAEHVVPGDILVLRAGQPIPADARVLEAHDFAVDESMLTGESEPVEKSEQPVAEKIPLAERTSTIYTGTVVATGSARAVVYATGQWTELGAIQRSLSRAQEQRALLEQQIDDLGRKLAAFSFVSAVVVIGLGFVRRQPIRTLLRRGIALAVAAIPEGFPSVGTTALALTSRQLREQGSVIRRLSAAETLGAVGVVCADKTGTLTENRMRIAELYMPALGGLSVVWQEDETESQPSVRLTDEHGQPVPFDRVRDLARIAALNADVLVSGTGEVSSASATERALVRFALAVGYPVDLRRRSARRIGEKRRTRTSPMMITTHLHPELGRIELAKGAPEIVAEHCADLQEDRAAIADWNEAMAARGLRVLALAWRRADQHQLQFAGLVGLRDPPRRMAREAIGELSMAGIRTLMLTGDQHRTGLAIAGQLGIPSDAVFSRVTPEAKLQIIEALQRDGKIVAMTGDGVNDGPALKAANVGIAMGERGTDLARAVADVVLAHDDLPALVHAIAQGRTLHDNVRRAIGYFIATNASEVVVMLFGAMLGIAPLAPLQLLWINLLSDIAPALALAVEPAGPDVMKHPPRDPRTPLFGPGDYRQVATWSTEMAAASLAAYALGSLRAGGRNGAYASTMAFASLMTSQLVHTERSRRDSTVANPHLRNVLIVSFLLQGAAMLHPGLRAMLQVERLRALDLAISVLSGAVAGGSLEGKDRRQAPLWRRLPETIVRHRDLPQADVGSL